MERDQQQQRAGGKMRPGMLFYPILPSKLIMEGRSQSSKLSKNNGGREKKSSEGAQGAMALGSTAIPSKLVTAPAGNGSRQESR
uniref:Uncharacterized protein n=1 Tax=Romanomermis culicivorax TaxID=13658 RepID=A0A915JHB9_ROMCU